MKYCTNELSFIKDCLLSQGLRSDLRSIKDTRETQVTPLDNLHSDGSLLLKRGYSSIRLSIEFNIEGTIESNYEISSFFLRELSEFPGIYIKMEIYKDDGNIRDLFYEGIRNILNNTEELLKEVYKLLDHKREDHKLVCNKLLSTVSMNNLLDDKKEVYKNILNVSSFAIFENLVISDPLKIEEESSDALVTVFHRNGEILSFIQTKSGIINQEIIQEIQKRLIQNIK
ncbi:putative exosome complex exonuclease 2 [Vairimorpha necatrix]|uniref:Exosome complex exonuclease 2 n=1 Tax=Vairimorpha necatrix TaxID=6039 RepID=A0AAX4JB56_9MICR